MESGYLYVVFGEKYRKELRTALPSLKAHTQFPIAVMADTNEGIEDLDIDILLIWDSPIYSYGAKIYCLLESPFKKTVFLDTDTFICSSIDGLFQLLDKFDVAVAHSNVPFSIDFIKKGNPNYSINYHDFIEFNTGVIGVNNLTAHSFLLIWKQLYEELHIKADQCAFRDAIINTEVRVATLPFEYNFLGLNSYSHANSEIRVLHGRFKHKLNDRRSTVVSYDYMYKLANRVNKIKSKRFFVSQYFPPISASWNVLNLLRVVQAAIGIKVKSKRKTI